MKVVIINGAAGSGKDEFVKQCMTFAECENISIIDPVKDIARSFGWDGIKDEKSRLFLARLKKALEEYNDYPFEELHRIIAEEKYVGTNVVFVHMRNPYDIERAVKEFKALTLLINRPGVDVIISNPEDASVYQYNYDFVLSNDGDIDLLKEKAKSFLDCIGITQNNYFSY